MFIRDNLWRINSLLNEGPKIIAFPYIEPTEPTHTVIKLIVASFATIECTSIYGFCTLFNPKGEIISNGEKDCSRNLVSVTMFDYGIWKCAVGTNKNMLNIVNTIEIVLEGRC